MHHRLKIRIGLHIYKPTLCTTGLDSSYKVASTWQKFVCALNNLATMATIYTTKSSSMIFPRLLSYKLSSEYFIWPSQIWEKWSWWGPRDLRHCCEQLQQCTRLEQGRDLWFSDCIALIPAQVIEPFKILALNSNQWFISLFHNGENNKGFNSNA